MANWPEYPLETFVDRERAICYGIVQPGEPCEDGVPIVRVNNFKDGRILTRDALRISAEVEKKYIRSRLKGGELLITLVGTMGLSAIAPDELCGWNVARAVGIVPLKTGVDKRWINFIIRSEASQQFIRMHANTTVQPTFNLRDLANLPIPMPPEEIRVPASEMLSAFDDKIDLNRRMNETLEEMARELFKDWFVDFGPTRAKIERRPPYLVSKFWDLFPNKLDEDGKPEGWLSTNLAAIADLNPESWSERSHPKIIYYVDLSNTKWGVIEKTEKFTWDSAPSRARRVLRPGDTIVGTVRPGNGSFSFISDDGLTGSTGFSVLRPKLARDQELVWLAATSIENIARLAHQADGGAYPAIRPDVVLQTEISLAPEHVRHAFAEICSGILKKIEANKQESRTLAETRDLLLSKFMSGDIRIADIKGDA